MEQTDDKSFLGTQPLGPLMLRLAVPSIAAQLVALLYNVVDRAFVGHIPGAGVDALTGLGIVLPLIAIIQAFGMYIGAGAAPLAGMRLGAGDTQGASRVVGTAVVMLAAVAVIMLAVCYPAGASLLLLFGASADTLPYAQLYLNVYLLGVPFMLAGHVLSLLLLAQGASRQVFVANTVASVLNVVLDALFIFACGWGVAGAAAATALSEAVCAAMVCFYLQKPSSAFRVKRSCLCFDAHNARRILGIGIGRFFVTATEGVLVIVLNAQMQRYGGDAFVAALTVLETLQLACFSISNGFTQGVQGILSYCSGAKLVARVKAAMGRIVLASLGIQVVCVGLLMLFAEPVVQFFTTDPIVTAIAVDYLPIFLAGMALLGAQFGMQSIYMGLGHGLYPFLVAFVRKIVLFIPLAFVLPLQFGAAGVFYAEPVSDIASVVFCSLLFLFALPRMLRNVEKPK